MRRNLKGERKVAAYRAVLWTRAEAVADALQSLAIESLDPGPSVRRLANAYIREEKSVVELSAAVTELDQRERRDS